VGVEVPQRLPASGTPSHPAVVLALLHRLEVVGVAVTALILERVTGLLVGVEVVPEGAPRAALDALVGCEGAGIGLGGTTAMCAPVEVAVEVGWALLMGGVGFGGAHVEDAVAVSMGSSLWALRLH